MASIAKKMKITMKRSFDSLFYSKSAASKYKQDEQSSPQKKSRQKSFKDLGDIGDLNSHFSNFSLSSRSSSPHDSKEDDASISDDNCSLDVEISDDEGYKDSKELPLRPNNFLDFSSGDKEKKGAKSKVKKRD